MTVQVFYKNKTNSKSSTVFALFTDENFKIQNISAYFSKKEVSFIEKIIRNNKISKKTISSFNLNENSSVILIPLKKNLTSSEVEQIGADFYKKLWEKKDKIWYSNDNCFSSSSWMSNISSGFGQSSNYYNNSWDYADQENIDYLKSDDAKQITNGNQQKLFDDPENDPMDFLDMPLDDDLLQQMDENQIADYVKNNNDEVINYLQQLKNDFFYNG